jgi:hypothetical protein
MKRPPSREKQRPLSATDVERYRLEWRAVQARFRRQPGIAVAQADDLVRRLLEGGSFSAPDRPPWVDTLQLGVLLGMAKRRDLKNVFAHYASIVEEILEAVSSDEIALDLEPPRVIDLRARSTSKLRSVLKGGKHA